MSKLNDEREILLQLHKEFAAICWQHQLPLRPPLFALTENRNQLGCYISSTNTIQISRYLIENHPWNFVMGVLKHEMAHLMDQQSSESVEHPHGSSFQKNCERIGVPQAFRKSQIRLSSVKEDEFLNNSSDEKNRILELAKKLMSLATSNNEHEAALAMKKVQQLYARYNFEQLQNDLEREYFHLVMTTHKKRIPSWQQQAISLLSEFYFVKIIFIKQFDASTLEENQAFEMIGLQENILMAEYVYYFLLQQVSNLLQQQENDLNRKMTNLEKKSYRLGIINGFREKLTEAHQRNKKSDDPNSNVISKALTLFENDPRLNFYLKNIYPRIHTRKSNAIPIDESSYQRGTDQGKKINLNKGIHKHSSKVKLLLG